MQKMSGAGGVKINLNSYQCYNMAMDKFVAKVFYATLVVLGVLSLIYMAFLARQPLLWIGIAAFLAVALNPVVHKVQRFMPKKNLALAAIVVLLAFCGVIGLLAWLFLAPLIQQLVNLVTNLPSIINQINSILVKTPFAQTISLNQQAIVDHVKGNSSQLLGSISQFGAVVLGVLAGALDLVIAFVAVLSLMFFMTIEGPDLKRFALKLTPKNQVKRLTGIGSDVYTIINGYVVGNFIISGIYGAASAVVLWLCGSPYFLILAVLVALIDLIPLVGATIGAALVSIIFLLAGQPLAAAAFAIYTIVYVQFESAVLNPAIYSKNVDVSPLTVLVSILIGGAVAGIMGALLAIPVAATLRVVVNSFITDN